MPRAHTPAKTPKKKRTLRETAAKTYKRVKGCQACARRRKAIREFFGG